MTMARASDGAITPQSAPGVVLSISRVGHIFRTKGRRVQAFGLKVTSVDADEGFWVAKDGRTAWIQIVTPAESPYTVQPGQTVSLNGSVYRHDAQWPSQIFFCPDRQVSAAQRRQSTRATSPVASTRSTSSTTAADRSAASSTCVRKSWPATGPHRSEMPRTDRKGTPYRWLVCASAADSMSVATADGNAARIASTRVASMNASPDSTVPESTR